MILAALLLMLWGITARTRDLARIMEDRTETRWEQLEDMR
jgi:hypothetical protein